MAFYIVGIHAKNRLVQAEQVQALLSEYGCSIRTRLGLHHVTDGVCPLEGVIVLELFGDRAVCDELYEKLQSIENLEVQRMLF